MVVCSRTANKTSGRSSSWHIRTDLIGKVAEFDGDHFVALRPRTDDSERGCRAAQVAASRSR
jgi:hypothetical protein